MGSQKEVVHLDPALIYKEFVFCPRISSKTSPCSMSYQILAMTYDLSDWAL